MDLANYDWNAVGRAAGYAANAYSGYKRTRINTDEDAVDTSAEVRGPGSSVAATTVGGGRVITVSSRGARWRESPNDRRGFLQQLLLPMFSYYMDPNTVKTLTVANPKYQFDATSFMTRSDMDEMLQNFRNAYKTVNNTTKGLGVNQMNVWPTNYVGIEYQNSLYADNFSNSFFVIKQFQTRFKFINTYKTRCRVTVYEFVCKEDGAPSVSTLYNNYFVSLTVGSTTRNAISAELLGMAVDTALADQNMDNHSRAIKYISRYWRLYNKAVLNLQPAGKFDYVTSLDNYKLYEWVYNRQVAQTIEYCKGLTRQLLVFVDGPDVFDVNNYTRSTGDAQVQFSMDFNVAGFNGLRLDKSHVIIHPDGTTVPRTIAAIDQRTVQESGEVPNTKVPGNIV